MKKVAIMTWHKNKNYGSALQAIALNTAIKNLGYETTFIKYEYKTNRYFIPKLQSIHRLITAYVKEILNPYYSTPKRSELFEEFISQNSKETNVCTNYSELYELNNQFDYFVCGSDQVWSLTNSFDDKYYLSFVSDDKVKISYAPSFGLSDFYHNDMRPMVKGLLERMDHISVREIQGANIVHNLIGTAPKVVADPTLLMNYEEWNKNCNIESSPKIKEKYILCYFLGNEKNYVKNIKYISDKLNLPCYYIPNYKNDKRCGKKVPFEVGPVEFMSLIKNAEYVCTDSFHGMAFSINFNTPFSVFKRFKDGKNNDQNSRIYSLVSLIDLQERLERETYGTPIDYDKVNIKVEELRKASLDFLKNALKTEKSNSSVKHVSGQICCGCGACKDICPVNAITTVKSNGFYKYKLDSAKCINCGQCKSVCPIIKSSVNKIENSKGLYSFKHKDEQVLKKSSSGGAAYALSRFLLQNGYAVCGAAYDSESKSAKHIIITDESQLSDLQGSKYIQSDINNCYKKLLEYDGKIAFFGTPCQVSAFNNLIQRNKRRDSAILIDLICHGIPSGLFWDKYIYEKFGFEHKNDVIDCSFRDKNYPWHSKVITLNNLNNKTTIHDQQGKCDYYKVFDFPIAYMPSCYECDYREKSAADIRLGDFWGKHFENDKTGVSMVATLTDKGESVFHNLSDGIIQKFEIQQYFKSQVVSNPSKPLFYKQVLEDAANEKITLKQIIKKYCLRYDRLKIIYKGKYIYDRIIGIMRKDEVQK